MELNGVSHWSYYVGRHGIFFSLIWLKLAFKCRHVVTFAWKLYVCYICYFVNGGAFEQILFAPAGADTVLSVVEQGREYVHA